MIYTRGGDTGTTSLVHGTRVSKASPRLASYGTVDALNSHLGLLVSLMTEGDATAFLLEGQRALFRVGALLATEDREGEPSATFDAALLERLERQIDSDDALLPPMRFFILPGGSQAAAQAHVCRTVCRRAERCIVELAETEKVDPVLQSYINRLSDYLFVLARKLNMQSGIDEKKL